MSSDVFDPGGHPIPPHSSSSGKKRDKSLRPDRTTKLKQSKDAKQPKKLPEKKRDKSIRPDRATKLKRRKGMKLTIVKSALLRYVKGSKMFANAFVFAVQDRVRVVSRKTVDMSVAFCGWVKEQFSDRDPATVDLNGVFEQTFFRQFMLGVDGAIIPDARISDYHARHPDLAPSNERHQGDRNIYSSASKRYLTNLKNALRVEGEGRIFSFVKRFEKLQKLSESEVRAMRSMLLGWELKNPPKGIFPMRRVVYETITEHRRILSLSEGQSFSKAWLRLDSSLSSLLRYNVFLNRIYEADGSKLFNVVPVCHIKSHFISIDTYVLYGILRELEMTDENEEQFVDTSLAKWMSLFKISQLQGKDCEFGYSMDTDGISMCMHFERPKVTGDGIDGDAAKREEFKGKFTPGPNDLVVGCDPRRINIFYMATILPNGEIKTFVLTRRQYYKDSGIFGARKHSEHWNKGVKGSIDALSMVSSKGSNLVNHQAYLQVYFLQRETLWMEYTRPRWARQRLALYGGKKRVFANFFNKVKKELNELVPDCNIVVAFGAAKFAPGGKGELSVPTSRASGAKGACGGHRPQYKECASRFMQLVTCEFRSSKVDYRDDSTLQNVAVTTSPRFALRGVLWNVRLREFVSRDLNAALNIRRNVLVRPAVLIRRNATGRLVQRIVKRIKPRN